MTADAIEADRFRRRARDRRGDAGGRGPQGRAHDHRLARRRVSRSRPSRAPRSPPPDPGDVLGGIIGAMACSLRRSRLRAPASCSTRWPARPGPGERTAAPTGGCSRPRLPTCSHGCFGDPSRPSRRSRPNTAVGHPDTPLRAACRVFSSDSSASPWHPPCNDREPHPEDHDARPRSATDAPLPAQPPHATRAPVVARDTRELHTGLVTLVPELRGRAMRLCGDRAARRRHRAGHDRARAALRRPVRARHQPARVGLPDPLQRLRHALAPPPSRAQRAREPRAPIRARGPCPTGFAAPDAASARSRASTHAQARRAARGLPRGAS